MDITGNPLYFEVTPNPNGEPYKIGDWQKVPEIIHDDNNVKGFFGEYRFLSNFGEAIVEYDGVIYSSTEKAYQAAKWKIEDRDYFVNCTNEEAVKYNRLHQPNGYPPDIWDEIKVVIMRYLLEQKFDPELNPENYQKLIATGDKYLEETNWWNDKFWGKNLKNEGLNYLGIILMSIRDDLKS